ncbi:hypothetical protein [Allonocardiopsis opalescens]|uniref:DUF4287 domain-containing protein n=1 Tax=Allonocardiopsis opalescens TaxID=1144618 RepID=A0A2T0Q548_9ACTN|nr:hypothetical protein [Allonocardiopsis opalescens]PRX98914.1 hypothetical protein CLV72_104494 [Allonocardiopsis opalescens]
MGEEPQPGEAPSGGTGGPAPITESVSDEALRRHTGRGWAEWFAVLDAWEAVRRTHTEIARRLVAEQRLDGWWAQSVTVGYEQHRGMRAPGQRSDGTYSANASVTVGVPVARLFQAVADAGERRGWLPEELSVRTATAPKSLRADLADGGGRVVFGFTAVGRDRSRVALEHQRLAGAEEAARAKAFWRERLQALKAALAG